MQFQPKTEKEILESNLWSVEPEYGFQIIEQTTLGNRLFSTCDTTSKSGNEMIMLVVLVYNDNGDQKIIIDYLLESMAGKLRNTALACGLLNKYESGELHATDFIGKTGTLRLRIEKDKNGQYADKNAIATYIVNKSEERPQGASISLPNGKSIDPISHEGLDDEIPF